jgi:protein-tyrosine-phosphatase
VRPMHVVVVCHANVARSVAAAHLLATALAVDGVDVEIISAGTHATEGQPASPKTLVALSDALGAPVSMSTHRAHQLTDDDVAWADLIVTMEAAQVRALRRWHPEASGKVATLALLAATLPGGPDDLATRVGLMALEDRDPDDGEDVADPAGGDAATYAEMMVTLVASCGELAGRLAGTAHR